MSKQKHKIVVLVEQAITDALAVLGKDTTFSSYTLARTSTSRPYREIRIENQDIFDAYRNPKHALGIGNHLKAMIPDIIGVYPKEYIPSNKVLANNNVRKTGLMIHVPL